MTAHDVMLKEVDASAVLAVKPVEVYADLCAEVCLLCTHELM